MFIEQLAVDPERIAEVVATTNPWRGNVPYWNRRDIAEAMNRKKTRHVIDQIEKAVSRGLIYKVWSNDGVRNCFVYSTVPPMF